MTFEEYLMEEYGGKEVAGYENWIENMDLEEIFLLADRFAIKEKEKQLKRIEKSWAYITSDEDKEMADARARHKERGEL